MSINYTFACNETLHPPPKSSIESIFEVGIFIRGPEMQNKYFLIIKKIKKIKNYRKIKFHQIIERISFSSKHKFFNPYIDPKKNICMSRGSVKIRSMR